jgi:hypothetical protein
MLDCNLANDLVSTRIRLLKSNASVVSERVHQASSQDEMIEVILYEIMVAQLEEFSDFPAFTVFSRDSASIGFGNIECCFMIS